MITTPAILVPIRVRLDSANGFCAGGCGCAGWYGIGGINVEYDGVDGVDGMDNGCGG